VVELEESNFTKLPGFDRHLMVLDGALKVVHHEHHTAMLKQYEQDSFKGSWDTVSYGRATDFNLMLKEGVKGRLEYHHFAVGQSINVKLENVFEKQDFFACFCYEGQISIEAKGKFDTLEEGEFLLISCDESLIVGIDNKGNKECSLIAAFIMV
jgi:environmental stress-induced protein Ves